VVEAGGCGAIIGAIVFTIIAGFITNARPTFLMRYSPLIGGLIGGLVSFFFVLAGNLKRYLLKKPVPSSVEDLKNSLQEKNVDKVKPKVKV